MCCGNIKYWPRRNLVKTCKYSVILIQSSLVTIASATLKAAFTLMPLACIVGYTHSGGTQATWTHLSWRFHQDAQKWFFQISVCVRVFFGVNYVVEYEDSVCIIGYKSIASFSANVELSILVHRNCNFNPSSSRMFF